MKFLIGRDGCVTTHEDIEEIPNYDPQPKKKRKQSACLVSVTQCAVFDEVGADLNAFLNKANSEHHIYEVFHEQIISEGEIRWRYHEDGKDIVLMMNYNCTTGYMMPENFVHVTCTRGIDNEIYLQCTCPIYDLIQRAGHHETPLLQEQEAVPNQQLTCMHCRFYSHHLLDMYNKLTTERSGPMSHLEAKINTSLQYMNTDVQLAGNVIYSGTTKFLCKSFDSLAIVNITFHNGKCYARCTQGRCSANFRNKHNIDQRDEELECTHICCHLQTLFTNLENFKSFFPDFFCIRE